MPHRKYRSLQRECHIQAALTGHKETKEELAKMEREYKVIADWLEARQEAEQQVPPPKNKVVDQSAGCFVLANHLGCLAK
jgi:hypothetical protein